MTIKDSLLKAAGLLCRARGCGMAATHGVYCVIHKNLRYQKKNERGGTR